MKKHENNTNAKNGSASSSANVDDARAVGAVPQNEDIKTLISSDLKHSATLLAFIAESPAVIDMVVKAYNDFQKARFEAVKNK